MFVVKKSTLLILSVVLLSSCTTPEVSQKTSYENLIAKNPAMFKEMANPGLLFSRKNADICEVEKILSPSVDHPIKVHDVITSIDGTLVSSRTQCIKNMIYEHNPGDILSLSIKRNNSIVNQQITLSSMRLPNDIFALLKAGIYGEYISLAIIPGEISNTGASSMGTESYENWKKSIRSQVLGEMEAIISAISGESKLLNLVDRRSIDTILQEQKFQATGMISEEKRIQLGKMLSATHLMIIDISRFMEGKKKKDIVTRRVIDITSGKTLAVVTFNM